MITVTRGQTTNDQIPPGAQIAADKINHAYKLATGEETFSRLHTSATLTPASQAMRMIFFTARKTETINAITPVLASTAVAVSLPTLIRYGVYAEEANGDVTLIASTPNDTTLFGTVIAPLTNQRTPDVNGKPLSVPWDKVAGTRYALAFLVVSGGTIPTILAGPSLMVASEAIQPPRLSALITAQADLPASRTKAQLDSGLSGNLPYFVMLS